MGRRGRGSTRGSPGVIYSLVANKDISIDIEAYERLNAHRREGESLGDVIRRVLPPTPTLNDTLRALATQPLADHAADAILDHVAARRARCDENQSRKHAS